MPRLPDVPGDYAGSTSDSIEDANGVLYFTAYVYGIQKVYKVVNGQAVPVPLEHDATARGGVFSPQLWGPNRGMYITPWDDAATAHWRIKVPDFAMPDLFAPPVVVASGYTEAPNGVIRIFNDSSFLGEETILLAPFHIPPGVLLNIGVRVSGPKAGLVGRVGPDDSAAPGWNAGPMLNVFTQEAGIYMFGTRPLKATADNTLLVVAEIGEVNLIVDIYGWWE